MITEHKETTTNLRINGKELVGTIREIPENSDDGVMLYEKVVYQGHGEYPRWLGYEYSYEDAKKAILNWRGL